MAVDSAVTVCMLTVVLLAVLFWNSSRVQGLTLSLITASEYISRSIPTDGSGRIDINNIPFTNDSKYDAALICQSSTAAENGDWYLHPTEQSIEEKDKIKDTSQGWSIDRAISINDSRIVRLRRAAGHTVNVQEGVFTCHINGDVDTPILVGIYYPIPPPAAPTGVSVSGVQSTTITVSWEAVEDADRYTVTFTQTRGEDQLGLCTSDSHTATVLADTTSASISVGQDVEDGGQLRAYTTYSITVVAVNDILGSSGDSDPITATTTQTSAAIAPSSVRVTAESSTVITVEWSGLAPCRLVNGLIVKYTVQYTAESTRMVEDVAHSGDWTAGGQTLTELTPFTNYSIQVAAVNAQGHVGVYSDPVTVETGEDFSYECKSNSSADHGPIIAGVIIAIIGVVVGVTGLITTFIMLRNFKMKSKPSSDSNQGVYVSTDNNPAYGVSQLSRPAPHSGPDTGLYEMCVVDSKDTHI